jgi:Glycosyltransferase family 87
MAVNKPKILIALTVAVLLCLGYIYRDKVDMNDFEVNYKAGQRIRDGETLYRSTDGHWQFKYLPFSAFLYVPLTLLPLAQAKAVWFGAVLMAALMIFFISSQLIDIKGNSIFSPALFAGLILARYFFREFQLGQINALITWLLLLAIWLLAGRAKAPAGAAGGALVGLATALKPYAAVFFPYFAIRKKWPALLSGLGVLGLAVFAPALFYGWKGNLVVLGEWKSSLAASTPSLLAAQDNISLLAFLMKRTHDRSLSLAIYGVVLAALAGLMLVLVHRGKSVSRPTVLDGFLLLALIPLISPLGWDYTFLSAAPALMLICRHCDKYRPLWKGVLIVDSLVICLSLYDLMGRERYAAFMASGVITPVFLVFVGYLVYLRIKGYA